MLCTEGTTIRFTPDGGEPWKPRWTSAYVPAPLIPVLKTLPHTSSVSSE